MQHLVDGDLASNSHGWQWTAGTGTDAGAVLPRLQPDRAGREVRSRRRRTSAAGCPSSPTLDDAERARARSGAGPTGTRRRWSTTPSSGRRRCAGTGRVDRRRVASLAAGTGSCPRRRPLEGAHARRTQDSHPACGRAGVHHHGPAGRVDAHRQRARRAGQLGDGAQRDGGARAGGLPRPAAHVGRPDPDRQGLPLLRRPHGAAGPRSTPGAAQQVGEFFDAAHGRLEEMLHQTSQPARAAHQPRRAWSSGPRADRAVVRSVQVVGLSARRGGRGRGALQRLGRERDDRAVRRDVRAAPVGRLRPPAAHTSPAGRSTAARRCRRRRPRGRRALRARRSPRWSQPRHHEPVFVGGTVGRWRSRSTPSTPCAACCTPSSSSTSWSSLVRDVLNRGLSVAIGAEHGVEPLVACSVVVAPVVVDGEHVGTVGVLGPTRMNYPQALATVEVVSDRLGRHLGDGGGLTWPTTTSCSACRAAPAPTRSRRRTASGPASCTPTPTPATPRAEEQFKQVAKAYEVLSDPDQRARYDRFGEAGVGGAGGPNVGDVFGGGGLGDLFDAFFGGSGRPVRRRRDGGPAGPPRGQDLEVVADVAFEQAVFGATVPVTVRTAVRCDDCGGSGAGRGHASRSRAASATAAARCSACARACSARWSPRRRARAAAALGQVIATPVPDVQRRRPRRSPRRRTRSTCPPASTPARRCGSPVAVRPGPAAAAPATCTCTSASPRTSASPATTTTWSRAAGVDRAGVARHEVHARRRSTATRSSSSPPARSPAGSSCSASAACPACRVAAAATCGCVVQVEVPTKLTEAEAELLRKFAEGRGEEVNAPEHGLFSRIKSAFT